MSASENTWYRAIDATLEGTDRMATIPRPPKKDRPYVLVFLAQLCGTLVDSPGKKSVFRNHWELLKWLREHCGFEGFTLHTDDSIFDPVKAVQSEDYMPDFMGKCADLGMPLMGLEGHVLMNPLGGMHPSRVARFRGFFAKALEEAARDSKYPATVLEQTSAAASRVWIDACQKGGFDLVAFLGGRAWAAAQYQWPGWPAEFRLKALALQATKIIPTLLYAADRKVRIAVECHPEMDIMSPRVLLLLRAIINSDSPKAASVLGANADLSHEGLLGGDGAVMMELLGKLGLFFRGHLKDSAVTENAAAFEPLPDNLVKFIRASLGVLPEGVDQQNAHMIIAKFGCSRYGDFEQRWSRGARRFQTFGTGQGNWDLVHPIIMKLHEQSEHGLVLAGEAECSKYKNMLQALQIMADNIRAFYADRPFIDEDLITIEPSDQDWEAFAKSDSHTAEELLDMGDDETAAVNKLLSRIPAEIRAEI